MKWFTDVFLKSLDERFSETTIIWLTAKQADVCSRYMKRAEYHPFYYITVGEYQYSMIIVKKGLGRMIRENKDTAFHFTERRM